MPDLYNALKGKDAGFLKIILELWGIELENNRQKLDVKRLAEELVKPDRCQEMMNDLPSESHEALSDLASNGGKLPWALFTKRYGEVREIGSAKRDREKPYLNINATHSEMLWYRGIVSKSFFDTAKGPEEFAFIPSDLLGALPVRRSTPQRQLGRPAATAECANTIPASDRIIDDLTTVLSGLRSGLCETEIYDSLRSAYIHTGLSAAGYYEVLMDYLNTLGILDEKGEPEPQKTRMFLEAGRSETLFHIFLTWKDSKKFNELRQIPGLQFEGEWSNDPHVTREKVLEFLLNVPGNPHAGSGESEAVWWSTLGFIQDIHKYQPDFQRHAGDYDSWFIRQSGSGEYLRGFKYWDKVDGLLLHYMIAGPMFWSGILDIASQSEVSSNKLTGITGFRFSTLARDLLDNRVPDIADAETASLSFKSDGRIHVKDDVPRTLRYQVGRFCSWEGYSKGRYRYRISPTSLERARRKGLTVEQLLVLLDKYGTAVPPNLVMAMKRWGEKGIQATIEKKFILRVNDPEIIQRLRNSQAARFLGDPLGPAAIEIQPGAWHKVEAAITELGYLAEGIIESDQQ